MVKILLGYNSDTHQMDRCKQGLSFSDRSSTVGHSKDNHSHSVQHYNMVTEQQHYTAGKTCHRSTLTGAIANCFLLNIDNSRLHEASAHILDRNSAHSTQQSLITFYIKQSGRSTQHFQRNMAFRISVYYVAIFTTNIS